MSEKGVTVDLKALLRLAGASYLQPAKESEQRIEDGKGGAIAYVNIVGKSTIHDKAMATLLCHVFNVFVTHGDELADLLSSYSWSHSPEHEECAEVWFSALTCVRCNAEPIKKDEVPDNPEKEKTNA